jgi:hypothetical protein
LPDQLWLTDRLSRNCEAATARYAAAMDLFNFFFGFFGLMLGLAAAEVAGGFANAVQARKTVQIGALTILLGLFVLIDLSSFWRWAWANKDYVSTRGLMIEASLLVTLPYYLAASLVFPRPGEKRRNLTAHYWANKRFVVAGVLIANLAIIAFAIAHGQLPPASAPLAWLGLISFYLPLVALLFTRLHGADLVLLTVLIAHFVITSAVRISGGG